MWSIVQTIELPFVLANKWCGAELLLLAWARANPVPLLEAFVRVFAPAAIGVRTVGFVERGTLGAWKMLVGGPGVKV